MSTENISHPIRRYLRAWALSTPLADVLPDDPRRGERDAAREAIVVIESTERVEAFFLSLAGTLQ